MITVSSKSQVVRCLKSRMAGILRYGGGITEDFLLLAASFYNGQQLKSRGCPGSFWLLVLLPVRITDPLVIFTGFHALITAIA